MNSIYDFLNTNKISYQRFDHPAVFTCEQAEQLCPSMPGCSIKNIFVHDSRNHNYFLVVVKTDKRIDLKKLKEILGASKLSFCSEEQLHLYLGVEPGSVTILGLMHDTHHNVKIIFDAQVWGQALQCHPLINTATLVIDPENIQRFLHITGHAYQIIDVPSR